MTIAATTPPVVSFVAKSGTGKTTFLTQLIPHLNALGLQVGVLKHHAHISSFDQPGKDTYKLAQAGAAVVVGVSAVQVAVFRQENGAEDLDAVLARDFTNADLVLTEGFKRGNYPKIEIHRAAHRPDLLCTAKDNLLAIVTDEPLPMDVPQFGLQDFSAVADFLLNWLQNSPN